MYICVAVDGPDLHQWNLKKILQMVQWENNCYLKNSLLRINSSNLSNNSSIFGIFNVIVIMNPKHSVTVKDVKYE